MSDFRELYKQLGFGRENNAINREIRTRRRNGHRRERRSQLFDVHREENLQCSEETSKGQEATTNSSSKQRDETAAKSNNAEIPKLQLESWRKEKYRRKLLEKKTKKPPFIVGIVVHHSWYSPPLPLSPPGSLCKLKENQPAVAALKKTVTKATEKRLAAKSLESKQPKYENRKIMNSQENKKLPLAPKDHEFKAPEGIKAIPLFGRRAMEAAQQSMLKSYNAPNIANISIASFNSDEGRCSLNPNNMSTPLPTTVPREFPKIFVISPAEKEPLRVSFSKAIHSPSESEPVNESPTNMWHEELTTGTATLKDTPSPVPPSIVISDEKGSARAEQLQEFAERSSVMDILRGAELRKSASGKNRGYGGTPKKSRLAQAANALIEQTPLSSQMFSRLSPFRIVSRSGEGDPTLQELQPMEGATQSDLTNNLLQESLNVDPENETCQILKNSSYDETRSTPATLSLRLSGCLSPMKDLHSNEGSTHKELEKSEKDLVETACSNEDKYTIQYFKRLLINETERLNGLCDSWGLVKNEISTPEDIKYLIQAAVGQTQLLIGNKFKRFRGLVEDCETGEGEMPVTCKDLLGFWELVYIEVEDCNARFGKLEQLKASGWMHANSPRNIAEKQKQKLAVKITAVQANKKTPPARSNSLKAHIMAARKKMIKSKLEAIDAKAEHLNQFFNLGIQD